jgi:uncharacterized phage protein gp47/JayE
MKTLDNPHGGVQTPGADQETDENYLRRYLLSLSRNARSPLDSVLASVLAVDGVTDAQVAENDTSAPVVVDGVNFAAHSIGVAVQGGVDIDIAKAIQIKKTIGALSIGTTTVTVPQAQGNGADGPDIDISFYRVTELRTVIDVDITTNSRFPANGIALIKQRIAAYFGEYFESFATGLPNLGDNVFETDGIQIGEDVLKSRLYTPINSVPGHEVNTLTLKVFGGVDVNTLVVKFDERAMIESLADVTVTVTS